MMPIHDRVKFDPALVPQSLNGAGTGTYFNMKKSPRRIFVWNVGAMAAGVTSAGQIMEAQDAQGTGAQAIATLTDTIEANTHVKAATLTAAAVQVGDTFVINGITFTGAAAQSLPDREFLANGADNNATAASIAACINDASTGVPGVRADANAAVVTVTADEPGETDIVIQGTAVRLVAATVEAFGYLEVEDNDLTDGFSHVALRVTNSAAILTSAVTMAADLRYYLDQHAAAGN